MTVRGNEYCKVSHIVFSLFCASLQMFNVVAQNIFLFTGMNNSIRQYTNIIKNDQRKDLMHVVFSKYRSVQLSVLFKLLKVDLLNVDCTMQL